VPAEAVHRPTVGDTGAPNACVREIAALLAAAWLRGQFTAGNPLALSDPIEPSCANAETRRRTPPSARDGEHR
jgi:hypothetical protein